ncbi:hypothetical protein BJN12_07285 [Listeria monocytogenes]|uniref:restriction endonuclease subunit S n=1 Tax=Listeria monocytogenes TaxID=1639 RepID=UPI000874DD93|nr:restriction endonuclease subunit S [Listeria monocytogenes]EAG7023193.1 restriction endonuclease subunit S [Listeria monocytogenes]EAG9445460.1 restriction endonuclease subunit S [Listeria monocytogenes]OFH62301.1 hypothetical protein BJN12_07285 [Listeria monocytogenes]
MSHSKKNIPKRRFKKFSNIESWEQLELGEVIEDQYNGQTPSRANDAFWKGNINWLSSGELNKGIVTKTMEKITEAGQDNARLKIIPKGTFVLAITGLEAAGTRGNCGILGIDTALNQSCMALFPNKKKLAAPFLFQWYLKIGEEYGIRYTQGTKQQSYNAALIKILPIALPSMGEQVVIAEFLDRLDNTITLHQRKLEKIKALKTAYLSEMFPAEGETKPKRRFAGFTDDWEQGKLLEHIEKVLDFRGKSPTKFGMEWLDKGYLVLSALNVKAGYIDKSVEAKFGSQELFDKWMGEQHLRKGDVVFTTEAPLGNVAQIPDNNGYILNQRAVAFKTSPDIMDNDFLAQFLRSPFFQYKLNMNASGGTAKGIGMKEFAKLSSYLPKDVKEQKKIGSLLKTIDNTITLHQRKLQKLQNIKKAYLNEMFI